MDRSPRRADLAGLISEPQVFLVHQPSRLAFAVFTTEILQAERISSNFGLVGLAVGASNSWSSLGQKSALYACGIELLRGERNALCRIPDTRT